jgi:poly-gamma-glutamate capsule biosynthesis protein CapA/YwtB (metallophosphatase superfamily)
MRIKYTNLSLQPLMSRINATGLILAGLILFTSCTHTKSVLGPQHLITDDATPTSTPVPIRALPSVTPTPDGVVTLMAVGDVMLGRSIGELMLSEGASVPFKNVADLFHSADWVVANLECAITNNNIQAEQKAYTFAASPQAGPGLAQAGINVVSLSNNHSLDYGWTGMEDTLEILHDNQILTFGVGENEREARTPLLLEKDGVTIALLGYTDVPIERSSYFDTRTWIAGTSKAGLAWATLPDVQKDVALARKIADVVVVYFHYGIENLDHASRDQHKLASGAIDAGASLVLGAHSHRLQEIERYNGGLIVYSLGNFIFDGFETSVPTNLTAVLSVKLGQSGVIEYTWYPMVIVDGIPQPADEASAQVIWSLVSRQYIEYKPGLEPGDVTD